MVVTKLIHFYRWPFLRINRIFCWNGLAKVFLTKNVKTWFHKSCWILNIYNTSFYRDFFCVNIHQDNMLLQIINYLFTYYYQFPFSRYFVNINNQPHKLSRLNRQNAIFTQNLNRNNTAVSQIDIFSIPPGYLPFPSRNGIENKQEGKMAPW